MFRLIILLVLLISCGTKLESEKKPSYGVLVTIAPYKTLVQRIAGDTVSVEAVVPQGQNSHYFEPSLGHVNTISGRDLWFRIGEAFENRLIGALKSFHPTEIVDLREGIPLLILSGHDHNHDHSHSHGRDSFDVHIWLSPRLLKTQAKTIAEALSLAYPEHRRLYINNLLKLEEELDNLDLKIQTILEFAKNKTVLVSHPAFAYFCQDYQLNQLALEMEGKGPSLHGVEHVMEEIRKKRLKRIFVQKGFNEKGASIIAKRFDLEIIEIDPLEEDLFSNLRQIAWKFAGY